MREAFPTSVFGLHRYIPEGATGHTAAFYGPNVNKRGEPWANLMRLGDQWELYLGWQGTTTVIEAAPTCAEVIAKMKFRLREIAARKAGVRE